MPLPDDIRAAAAAGIVSAEQAEQLVTFLAARPTAVAPAVAVPDDAGEEAPRFVRSFQDVFLTIGIVLLLIGIGVLSNTYLRSFGGFLVGAAVSYFLAIGFAQRRRLVLPSMALALGFVLFVGLGVTTLLAGSEGTNVFSDAKASAPLFGALGAFAAALAFFLSFRLPFALGLIAAGGLAIVFVALRMVLGPESFGAIWAPALLVSGLLTFAAAMAFDLSDPLRRTLRADNAFWLHLVAAPMIVHAVFNIAVRNARSHFSFEDAIIVLAVVLVLALVALVIDRRALFVSALSYFGFAIAVLVPGAGINNSVGIATTLAVTGGVVLALGVGWRSIRGALLARLPRQGLFLRLPPVGNPLE
ncbi:MAG TPA: hypothetical protein VHA70_03685 [Bauldia sp.]|nr:hypothetical protein [Bauldia sp.]